MADTALAAAVGGVTALVASPYLAGLTLRAPDRDDPGWWHSVRPGRGRWLITATIAVVLGALAGGAAGWSALLPALVALAVLCTPLVVIDFEQHRLPNRLVFAALLVGAVLLALAAAIRRDWPAYLRAVEGGAAVFAVLFLLVFAVPRSFGFGDVKLAAVLGGYLGWFGWSYVYYGIFAGFLLGMLVAIGLLATRRASLKSHLAFGPMLVFGTLIVLGLGLGPAVAGS